MEIHPQRIYGQWEESWALDLHTTASHRTFTGGWFTERPPIAEALYQLKYAGQMGFAQPIAEAAAAFLRERLPLWRLEVIIPVPPSDTTRSFQPVYEIARRIGQLLSVPINFSVLEKTKPTGQLKDITDPAERRAVL